MPGEDDLDALLDRARALMDLNEPRLAEEVAARAVAARPEDWRTWHARGLARRLQNRYEAAVADFDRALALEQGAAVLWGHRGVAFEHLDLARALEDLARAEALDPTEPEAPNSAGYCHLALGDRERARACFDRATAMDPAFVKPYVNRGKIHLEAGRPADALAEAERGLAARQDFLDCEAELHVLRGSALAALDRSEEALAAWDVAIALQPNHLGALTNRGALLSALGEHARALADLRLAVAFAPDDPDPLVNRGVAYLAAEIPTKALEDLDHAAVMAPDDPTIHLNRAAVHYALGDLRAALADIDRVLALDPEDPDALDNRTLLQEALGGA